MIDNTHIFLGSIPIAHAVHFERLFEIRFSRRCCVRVPAAENFAVVLVPKAWPATEVRRMLQYLSGFNDRGLADVAVRNAGAVSDALAVLESSSKLAALHFPVAVARGVAR